VLNSITPISSTASSSARANSAKLVQRRMTRKRASLPKRCRSTRRGCLASGMW
jgi:hypothetical protein